MRSAPVHLAIFDERQGGSEGDPSDQLLAYHPAEIPKEEQAGAVGLVRAVATFAHIFAGASPRPAHGQQAGATDDISMDARQHRWVSHEVEPHLGLLLIADADWCGTFVRDGALQNVLHRVHGAVCLLHGSIQTLLSQQGVMAAMQSLNEVLAHFGRLLATGAPHVLDPSTCLGLEQGLPYLAVSREVFTGLQALSDRLALLPLPDGGAALQACRSNAQGESRGSEAKPGDDGGAVLGVVALHGSSCMWSSLERHDTAALAGLAAGALLPPPAAQQSPWKLLKSAALATAGRSPAAKTQAAGRSLLDRSAWAPAGHGFLQLATSRRSSVHEQDQLLSLPLVHLQGAGGMARPVQLLPLQLGGGLLLLLVMHEGWRADPSAQAALAASAGQHADRLFSALHAEVAAEQGGHIKGFRYLYQDDMPGLVRGSPAVKTATLARDSALLAAGMLRQLDHSVAWAQSPEEVEMEAVTCSADSDCWVSGHVVGRRKLVLVMEGRGEGGLQEAAATTARFAATHTPGLF